MINSKVSTYATTTFMLTDEGWIFLAADALAAAKKTRNERRKKALCEQAMRFLRHIVQAQGDEHSQAVMLHNPASVDTQNRPMMDS